MNLMSHVLCYLVTVNNYMSNIKVTIVTCLFGDINYTNDKTYFLPYSRPYFSGMLKIETELWETHELMYSFFYETGNLVIINDVEKFNPHIQAAYMKAEPYTKMKTSLLNHFNTQLGDPKVYSQFVDNACIEYHTKLTEFKKNNKNLSTHMISRKMKNIDVFTDHFDLSKFIGTVDIK